LQLGKAASADESAGHYIGDQPRLGNDQERAQSPERDRDLKERAGRARVSEQSRIERPQGVYPNRSSRWSPTRGGGIRSDHSARVMRSSPGVSPG
jgi:hypothetical protein